MKFLKVVFFGTPEFAKTTLQAIHESHHEVVGVVTATDKASGRGMKVKPSAVKQYAEEQHLPVFQPEKLRNPEFLQQMRDLNADVFVVVAFRMMPRALFTIPPRGTFNLHASLLPDYRGAAPVNFAIINGEDRTGVTTFFINEKIDEGHILLQETVAIDSNEDAGSLHDRLMCTGAGLVVETLDAMAQNSLTERPQPEVKDPKNAYKIYKEDTRIHWDWDSARIHNFVRGMSPHPAAFTMIRIGDDVPKILKIYKGRAEKTAINPAEQPLTVSKTEFKFRTADGYYHPAELQLEGKKRMDVNAFINGFKSFDDIKLA